MERSQSRQRETCRSLMLGAGMVGKTELLVRYITKRFRTEWDLTIEDYYRKTILINNIATDLSILDTSGLSDYGDLIDHWLEKKDAIVLVYRVDDPGTMQRLREYYAEISYRYDLKDPTKAPLLVIAASIRDRRERLVSTLEGQQFAEALGAAYFEVSAQSNLNVDEMFAHIVWEWRKRKQTLVREVKGRNS